MPTCSQNPNRLEIFYRKRDSHQIHFVKICGITFTKKTYCDPSWLGIINEYQRNYNGKGQRTILDQYQSHYYREWYVCHRHNMFWTKHDSVWTWCTLTSSLYYLTRWSLRYVEVILKCNYWTHAGTQAPRMELPSGELQTTPLMISQHRFQIYIICHTIYIAWPRYNISVIKYMMSECNLWVSNSLVSL